MLTSLPVSGLNT